MTKPSTLGNLSQSLQSQQGVIHDTVKEQIASELLSLKQTINACVTSEVSRYLNDLSQTLKNQSNESVRQITESQQDLCSRIDPLLDYQPLFEAIGAIEQMRQAQSEQFTELLSHLEQDRMSQIQQVQLLLEQGLSQEKLDYQAFLREQQSWRTNLVKELNQAVRQPWLLWVVFSCLLAVSLGVNLTVLLKWQVLTTFLMVMFVLILGILMWCGGYLAYQKLKAPSD